MLIYLIKELLKILKSYEITYIKIFKESPCKRCIDKKLILSKSER